MGEKTLYRVLFINAVERTVTEKLIYKEKSLETLQQLVGGNIEGGTYLPNGDMIFVNEEGAINGTQDYFVVEGSHYPLAGNGVIVSGEEYQDCVSTVSSIKVKFKTLKELKEETNRGVYG